MTNPTTDELNTYHFPTPLSDADRTCILIRHLAVPYVTRELIQRYVAHSGTPPTNALSAKHLECGKAVQMLTKLAIDLGLDRLEDTEILDSVYQITQLVLEDHQLLAKCHEGLVPAADEVERCVDGAFTTWMTMRDNTDSDGW